MADYTFYTNPMSRGQIARWALHEVGADYAQVLVDWGARPPALLAANPMGKVPVLVHHTAQADRVVTECAAICAYLADAFPAAGLAPDPADRADYYRWMFFTAGPVEQAITATHFGIEPDADQQRSAGFGTLGMALDALESAVAGKAYVAGDRFTAADVYVGSQVDWGLQFGTISSRPAFEAYAAGLRERAGYKAAKAIDNALIAEMQAAG